MEAALEEPVYKVGNNTNGEEGAKETVQPSPVWAWDGGQPGAHAINMVRGPREGKEAPREWETR